MNGHSVRRLLLGWLLIPLVALLVIGAVSGYFIALRPAITAYDGALMDTALALSEQVKWVDGRLMLDLPPVAENILRSDQYDRIYYAVGGAHGNHLGGDVGLPLPPADRENEGQIYYDGDFRGKPIRVAALKVSKGDTTVLVRVAETMTKREKLIRKILIGTIVPEALLAAAALGLVWFGIGLGLAPLQRLRRELAARSSRDLRPLPADRVPIEVLPVVGALNELLGRLKDSLAAQQGFIANAAHQLRTPLAGLQTHAEFALRQPASEELHHSLEQMSAAIERTARLANQLLVLGRAEPGGHNPDNLRAVDLRELVHGLVAEWLPRALAKDLDLGFELDHACILADPLLIRELVANLLDNAVRYAPAGGRVTVRSRIAANEALLEVEDNGPGIPEGERAKVLGRFYRIRGTPGDGSGLGLSIVEEIVRAHGGRLEVAEPAEGNGTLVTVRFRLAAE